jgi:hypothetical protein
VKTSVPDPDIAEKQRPVSYELGWTKGDPPRRIWGLSHTHLANAIDQFSEGSGEVAHESLVNEVTAAWTGFAWLSALGKRLEVTAALAAACDNLRRGVTEGDTERTMRGYSAVETIVSRLRERFGEDLGRSWNVQEIDAEFDRVSDASAKLVERLKHKQQTDADTANTYEFALKIARGWTRLVRGSYFLGYSEPYSEATASIVSGMKNRDLARVQAGIEKIAVLAARLSQVAETIVVGERPRKGNPVEFPDGVLGGRYVATTDGRPVAGYVDRWSVNMVFSDPRDGHHSRP